MSQAPSANPPLQPEPAWEIARLFPDQGFWSDGDYLGLDTNRLVELCDGRVEVLPMPTTLHQRISSFLFQALLAFITARGLGEVLYAPVRVRLRNGRYREPDIIFMLKENAHRIGERYWERPDLVMEVVSEDDPDRDWVTKREEYAEAGIPEYWIIDPRTRRITVLTLRGETYAVHAEAGFDQGACASSLLLNRFEVDSAKIFNAGRS